MKALILSAMIAGFSVSAIANGVSKASNKLGWDVFNEIANKEKGRNLVYSPLSTSQVFQMAYLGSTGENKKEMGIALGYSKVSRPELLKANAKFVNTLNAIPMVRDMDSYEPGAIKPAYELTLANALWAQEGVAEINQSYEKAIEKAYGAEVASIPFGKEGGSIINEWAAEKTEGRIQSIVPEDIPTDQLMILTNALRIKASWMVPFSRRATKEKPFQISPDKSVMVPMMRGKQPVKYISNRNFEAVSVPTDGLTSDGSQSRIQMMFIMPRRMNPAEILGADLMEQVVESVSKKEMQPAIVYMPMFKIEPEQPMNLVGPLRKLGMKRAFAEVSGNFDYILDNSAKLYVSAAIQKAFIEVNEDGLEAAAVTAVIFGTTSVGPPPPKLEIKIDSPFVYVIRDMELGVNLFVGVMNNPKVK